MRSEIRRFDCNSHIQKGLTLHCVENYIMSSGSSLRLGVFLIACWGITNIAHAQDFKVYTPVFDMKATETSPRAGQRPQRPIVARSLTYFHAGKAYDYIETEEEVLIYEPNAKRFTVLHNTRSMATTIGFDELEQMVQEAESKAQQYVTRSKEATAEQPARLDMISFQLQPTFREVFDRKHNTLVLKSPYMNYLVKGATVEAPERIQFYLKYCDWMARLNYVLHPQAPLPGPRLTLNGSLKKFGMMPVEVELQASIGNGIDLKAEHTIDWQLDSHDRDRIHQWQTQLAGEEIQHVPFNRFREVKLADQR